jgi:RED-like protein C-terminal region
VDATEVGASRGSLSASIWPVNLESSTVERQYLVSNDQLSGCLALQAAFQFGLKMADGRKSHKNLVNKANTKLKNELSSIKVRPFASRCSMHPDEVLLLSK